HTILRLTDTNGDGVADNIFGFATYKGTGMAIKNGFLYASSDENIYRYPLNSNDEADTAKEELLVSGLINRHMHEAKAITLDNAGNIYVNVGAYSNACQSVDRTKGSAGMQPCPILDSAGGIWTFKADKPNQLAYKDGEHYATGLRNVVGLDWNNVTNSLFVMQHGRDQLHDLYPQYFDTKQSAELPAECMYELHQGADAGWPYMYYDQIQHKKILAPEYGGDGKKTAGEKAIDPAAAYPGHMAPDGLLFYTGNQFPEKYKNGAFIAFHGSWNRAPEPQKGYFVVFQPFKDGKPNGDWEIFADNFAGIDSIADPGKAAHRPCGLAQGPDGALYVTDDVKGRVYKISYSKK
ncbi:MAG: PQQ-dependent sugar dehydrogenase, partial [Chitinophagaceae bacterium]|nr:PQQ-dependent sugar dehydrogenase [Chitinophagaceae bacterium]